MGRKVIPLVTGEKYHVYNRGVDKRTIFIDSYDYLRFYQSLAFFNTVKPTLNYRLAKSSHSQRSQKLVNIYAYALIPNHYHLIIEQVVNGGVSEFMKRISGGYTNYFNERYIRTGSLFQGKYKKVLIENESQFNYLFAYVNENHTVHDISTTRDICHTSSLHYQGVCKSKIISDFEIVYDYMEAQLLAKEIFTKRSNFKDALEQ